MPTRVSMPMPVFPESIDHVPEAMRVAYYNAGARYLIDGQVREWTGPCQEVLSPICVGRDGNCQPFALGHYPIMTQTESKQALDAATRAYNHGCGAWPTMSVADRIHHVESFVPRMVAQRAEVGSVHVGDWQVE